MIIEPDPKRIERKIVPLFDSMCRSAARLYDRYTAEELTLILDFSVRVGRVAEEETRKLQEPATPQRQRTARKKSD